jgi:pimeloyl-ACP methyl ester carboxylesterase
MGRGMKRLGWVWVVAAMCATPAAAAQIVEGVAGDGARYALAVPDAWNGDLIVYGHGIVDPAAPVALPGQQDGFSRLRDAWLQRGFAVASSSYSENGFALKDAAQRLHQLSGLFTARFGRPSAVYLVGHSLGAAAIESLAERFPDQYDAALPMCGLLGGTLPEVQYLGDARVLFDFHFPGVLPGDVLTVPDGIPFAPGDPAFLAALNALLGGFAAPGAPTVQLALAAKLPFSSGQEIVQAALTALGCNLRFTNDLLERTHGQPFYDNTTTVYPGAANDGAGRFTATPAALNFLGHYFTPTGELRVPTLTLHTMRDPAIPVFHERLFADAATRAGAGDRLVQRTVQRFGHCAFSDAEVLSSFDALVSWVRTGIRPAGGDATDNPSVRP